MGFNLWLLQLMAVSLAFDSKQKETLPVTKNKFLSTSPMKARVQGPGFMTIIAHYRHCLQKQCTQTCCHYNAIKLHPSIDVVHIRAQAKHHTKVPHATEQNVFYSK